MFWQRQIIDYIDGDSAIKQRTQLLEHHAFVAATVWSLIAANYLFVFKTYNLAIMTLIGCMASIATIKLVQRFPQRRLFLANFFVSITVFVFCGCTVVTEFSFSQSALYYPIIILLAARLVGVKVAFVWTLALLAIAGMDFANHLNIGNTLRESADRMINSIGTIITTFWLSFESEKFFNIRSRRLEKITASLQEKTRLLELAEETAGVGHWRWDSTNDQVTLSSEALTICGFTQQTDIISLDDFVQVWSNNDAAQLKRNFIRASQTPEGFSQELTLGSGETTKYVNCRGLLQQSEKNDVGPSIFGTLRDDTQLRSATDRLTVKAEQLNRLASFDPLTGLANRLKFQEELAERVQDVVANDSSMALLVLDMNGFKAINDSMGHAAGDEVLKTTAKRISRIVSSADLVSRLGGDEFTVIIQNTNRVSDIEAIANRIIKSIAAPMQIEGQEVYVGVSIGMSLAPTDSTDADELFCFADTAMYVAKTNQQGLAIYTTEMSESLRNRRSLENRLASAIRQNEFSVVYQPQCNIATGEITAFEALLRWTNDGKIISPLEFIPLLEGNGQIVEVGQWVFNQACAQAAQWQAQGLPTRIAINISPIQFRDPNFIREVKNTIGKYNLPPNFVELEITEGLLVEDIENTSEKLFELKEFGCRISVDDFGTGYSSLAYLKHLPIDVLKIDREFIKDIPSADDGTIAASVIVLGQSLNMEVLAEGVETPDQVEFLKTHNCHAYQGNLLSKPITGKKCVELMQKHSDKNTSTV